MKSMIREYTLHTGEKKIAEVCIGFGAEFTKEDETVASKMLDAEIKKQKFDALPLDVRIKKRLVKERKLFCGNYIGCDAKASDIKQIVYGFDGFYGWLIGKQNDIYKCDKCGEEFDKHDLQVAREYEKRAVKSQNRHIRYEETNRRVK